MNDNSRKSGWEWLDRDTSAFLYEYLTMGADIPEPVRKHFGFDRDYLLYEKINGMDYDEYLRQREEGRFPDVLEVDGIHKLIRVLRPPHARCVIETNGSRPTVLDDLVGAGYADIVSFVFDRYPKKCQLDSMRIARDGDCRFAVTVVTEPQRLTVEDVLDLGDHIKGAMLLQIKRSSEPGALQYKKSEISSLAKSMKGTAKEVRIV